MKNIVTILLFTTTLLAFSITGLKAQQAVIVTGGNALGSGGNVSYSVGQVNYITNTGNNGSVAEGVQQPFEISVVIGIEEAKEITLLCSAYPNPTNDYLILKIGGVLNTQCIALLYDIKGKLIENQNIVSKETFIAMRTLAPSIYFLKIINNDKEIKTFKIIKN